ncbi:MAG TPA: extracellular solute-binding protein [Candidatus Acidoferrales bacterium]|nr:extracellular solute-binding protein [Candidatus Acidoferrales bacterium]
MARPSWIRLIRRALCLIVLCGASVGAASVEDNLEKLNRLPSKARAEALEREALKERELVWYGAMNIERAAELIRPFEAKYPFLKVRFQGGGASRLLEQLLIEHRNKKHRADVINTRRSFVRVMVKEKAVVRYRTPLREFLRDGFADREGYVNSIYAQPRVFLINTKVVPLASAPRTFDALLEPKWKDMLGLESTDYDWLASLIDYYGTNRALEFAKNLARQNLQLRRGTSLLSQLVVAGEFPVMIDAFPEEAIDLKNARAPVDFLFPEPFVPVKTPTTVSLAAGAPHPHAAALFIDFLLSQQGQEIMAQQRRWVSRKDVRYLTDLRGKKMVIPSHDWDERQVELIKLFNDLFLKDGK